MSGHKMFSNEIIEEKCNCVFYPIGPPSLPWTHASEIKKKKKSDAEAGAAMSFSKL